MKKKIIIAALCIGTVGSVYLRAKTAIDLDAAQKAVAANAHQLAQDTMTTEKAQPVIREYGREIAFKSFVSYAKHALAAHVIAKQLAVIPKWRLIQRAAAKFELEQAQKNLRRFKNRYPDIVRAMELPF